MKNAILLLLVLSPLLNRAQYQDDKQNVEACFTKWMNSIIAMDFENAVYYSTGSASEFLTLAKDYFEIYKVPEGQLTQLQSLQISIMPEYTEVEGDLATVCYQIDDPASVRASSLNCTNLIRQGDHWLIDHEDDIEVLDYVQDNVEGIVPVDGEDEYSIDPEFREIIQYATESMEQAADASINVYDSEEDYDSLSEDQIITEVVALEWLQYYYGNQMAKARDLSTDETKELIDILQSLDTNPPSDKYTYIRDAVKVIEVYATYISFPDENTAVVPYSFGFDQKSRNPEFKSQLTLHRTDGEWLVHFTQDDLEMEYEVVHEK